MVRILGINAENTKAKPIYFILVILRRHTIRLAITMCQDILINVIFGCESELWKLQFGVNRERHTFVSVSGPAQGQGSARETLTSNIILLSTIVTVSQIKFALKCLLNSLLYFIGLLVIRNEQQYLIWFIFIKLLFILIESMQCLF